MYSQEIDAYFCEDMKKMKGQYLDNKRCFCEENYRWGSPKTDELVRSSVNESLLQEWNLQGCNTQYQKYSTG